MPGLLGFININRNSSSVSIPEPQAKMWGARRRDCKVSFGRSPAGSLGGTGNQKTPSAGASSRGHLLLCCRTAARAAALAGLPVLSRQFCARSQCCCSAQPQGQATQVRSPKERALPLRSVLGEKGVPWSTERQGYCGHCTLVRVQNCALTCRQPEIRNEASLKRRWSLMGILVAFPAPSREMSRPGSHRSPERTSCWGQPQLSSKLKVINMDRCGT